MNISCNQTHFQNILARMCLPSCHRWLTWKRRAQVRRRCSTLNSACSTGSTSCHCNCLSCASLSWTSIRAWLLARLHTFSSSWPATPGSTLYTVNTARYQYNVCHYHSLSSHFVSLDQHTNKYLENYFYPSPPAAHSRQGDNRAAYIDN